MAEAAAAPPGANGVLLLPYVAGERTPIYDSDARGVVAGLTLRHGRGDLLRAVYEGTALAARQIVELLRGAGDGEPRVVAVGGGTQSDLWLHIVSDVTGAPQPVPLEASGAANGDGLLAAEVSLALAADACKDARAGDEPTLDVTGRIGRTGVMPRRCRRSGRLTYRRSLRRRPSTSPH